MIIKSTCFPDKDIHKETWKMPGSNVVNQIDHIIVSSKQASDIIDVKTIRGPNCDTDHYLVRAIIRQRLANIQKDKGERRKKWNTKNLKNEDGLKEYQEAHDKKLSNLSDIITKDQKEERWELLKSITVNAAQETVSITKHVRNEE